MPKIRYNFTTDPEIPDMMAEMAEADNRQVSPWLTLLIKREYAKFKELQVAGTTNE